jgi:hypothetical protein
MKLRIVGPDAAMNELEMSAARVQGILTFQGRIASATRRSSASLHSQHNSVSERRDETTQIHTGMVLRLYGTLSRKPFSLQGVSHVSDQKLFHDHDYDGFYYCICS